MDKSQLEKFLEKLLVRELRKLATKLSVDFYKKDNKSEVVKKIIDQKSPEAILEKLGLKTQITPENEDDLLNGV